MTASRSIWLVIPTLLALIGFPIFVLAFTAHARLLLGGQKVDFYFAYYNAVISGLDRCIQQFWVSRYELS